MQQMAKQTKQILARAKNEGNVHYASCTTLTLTLVTVVSKVRSKTCTCQSCEMHSQKRNYHSLFQFTMMYIIDLML